MFSTTRCRLAALAIVLAMSPDVRASNLENLLSALSGQDEQARALARQLLPREGVGIVPRILPLLSSNRPAVREASYQILADLANEASGPGRAEERRAVTAHLMTLLADGQSPEIKVRGLRLLPISCPPDGDVGPIAALLTDSNLRERAREALEEIGTGPSRKALREFLGKAGTEFDVALLNSLGRLRDHDSLPRIAELITSGEPSVRVAAARALAWTGDPQYLADTQRLLDEGTPALRPDAADALLRLLGSMGRQTDRRKAAADGYMALLRTSKGQVKDGAMAGLGRIGDPSTVSAILAAIQAEGPPTSNVGLTALSSMTGAEVTKALVAAYPSAPEQLQRPLLAVLGSRRDPAVLRILERAARSASPMDRLAAYEALAATGLPQALDFLADSAKRTDAALRDRIEAIRKAALEREKARLLDRLQQGGAAEPSLLGQLGVIGRWWVVGPFDLGEKNEGWDARYIGEPDVNVVARYMAGKVRRQWKRVDAQDSQGRINLRDTVADRDRCVGYAYAEIELDEAVDAILLLGVDDSERVWLNGEKVFEHFTRRGLQVDQDRIPIRLKAGTNRILLKVYQDSLGWEFCARIARPEGQPVPFTQKAE